MKPPACSSFQNLFPGRAKCSPNSPDRWPGLIPQKRTRRSGPTRSAMPSSVSRPCPGSFMAPGERGYARSNLEVDEQGRQLLRL